MFSHDHLIVADFICYLLRIIEKRQGYPRRLLEAHRYFFVSCIRKFNTLERHIRGSHNGPRDIGSVCSCHRNSPRWYRQCRFHISPRYLHGQPLHPGGRSCHDYPSQRGGMLTNFPTIRKAVKKMATIDKLTNDGTYSNLSKREILQISRQRAKLDKTLGSIADLTRLPSALFVIDVMKENIAVREANRLGIPVFGIVDTNSDPTNIDFVIPANDDATKSVEVILDACCAAMQEGLEERKAEKVDMEAAGEAPANKGKKKATKARLDKSDEEAINAAKAAAFMKEEEA